MATPRMLVRILVGAALCVALTTSAVFPLPDDLPSVALGQTGLYRLEIALSVFYGLLLLVTPAYSGLAAGRLPIEISTRGAKFSEEADRSAAVNRSRIKALRRSAIDLTEALSAAEIEIEQLRKGNLRDSTKRKVDSGP
jgi:hypothetical protein